MDIVIRLCQNISVRLASLRFRKAVHMVESHRLFKGFGKIIVVNVFLFGDVLQPVERRKTSLIFS